MLKPAHIALAHLALLLPAGAAAQPLQIPAKHPAVRATLETLRADNAWTLEQQTSICEIPAPPFKEAARAAEFKRRKLDPSAAPLYAQMLVGMVALTGQWWLDSPKMKKADVAAHLVNLAWNGLAGLEKKPTLRTTSA